MRRILFAMLAALAGLASPAVADQSGGCLPTTGTYTGLTAAGYINAGFTSIFSASSGASPPSNPCGGNPLAGQLWLNTASGTTQPFSVFDGTQWLTVGTLDVTGHRWLHPPFPTQLLAADGTLAAPGISFSSDPNTGIFRSGDGSFDLVSNGVSQVSITSAGVTVPTLSGLAQGQARLIKSGTNLVLFPYNGNQLTIGGVNRTVPSSGVSLAPGVLSVNQLYYIYAFMTGSVMGLEASTTVPIGDAIGWRIKTGDPSRTLVGMARTVAGPAWVDTPTQRLVASWFNRQPRSLNFPLAGSSTVSQISAGQFPVAWQVNFVTFTDTAMTVTISSNWDLPETFSLFLSPWVDGTTGTATYGSHQLYCGVTCAGNWFTADSMSFAVEFSEGYHTVGLGSWVNGGSATFISTGNISGIVMQ